MTLTHRDVHLLDGHFFFKDGWTYRKMLGLDFVAGLQTPPTEVMLLSHKRSLLVFHLETLLRQLETQSDLVAFDYSYEFETDQVRGGGMKSGFRVRGYEGTISVRPSGYCDLTLLDVGPNGRGRFVEIIDMRILKRIQTDDKGLLKVQRRKAAVGWFGELPKVLEFLRKASGETVEVFHLK